VFLISRDKSHPASAKDHADPEDQGERSCNFKFMVLNVGKTTIAAWEQGTKKPSDPASELLQLVDRKGLDVLA
jgi:hypothetical protein